MAKNKIMESVNEETVTQFTEGVSNSKGIVGKLVVGALGVAATVGTVLFLKNKRKNKEVEGTEEVELIPNDENK